MNYPDFGNTEIAFRHMSNMRLWKARLLFEFMAYKNLSSLAQNTVTLALKAGLPIAWLVKYSVFEQFCGGENIHECKKTIDLLGRYGVGTILDYAAEGMKNEKDFDRVCTEICNTILLAARNPLVPFSVFKTTGLGKASLLTKMSSGEALNVNERKERENLLARIEKLCQLAEKHQVRIFIDAEETWIQDAIDDIALNMMRRFNKKQAIVFNTVQLYRRDRIEYMHRLFADAEAQGFFVGLKLVRGAYLETENERAAKLGRPSPIHVRKEDTDMDYDRALELCVERLDYVSVCAGTHNEQSTAFLVRLMQEKNIDVKDRRIMFSQLLGMSDQLTFNLAASGYNVSKYVPYGSVKTLIPYLIRRAEENSSIRGQMGRELRYLKVELARRSNQSP